MQFVVGRFVALMIAGLIAADGLDSVGATCNVHGGSCEKLGVPVNLWPMKNFDGQRTGTAPYRVGVNVSLAPSWRWEPGDPERAALCNVPRLWEFAFFTAILAFIVGWGFGIGCYCFVGRRIRSAKIFGRGCLALAVVATLAHILVFGTTRIGFMCPVLYASPVLDSQGNIYVSSSAGWLFSLRPDGTERWRLKVGSALWEGGGQVPTPTLLGDTLYVADGRGDAWAVSLKTGDVLWRSPYAAGNSGADAWSTLVAFSAGEAVLLLAGNAVRPPKERHLQTLLEGSGSHIFAVSGVNGSELWRRELRWRSYNFLPCVVDGVVFLTDLRGGVYSMDLATGNERWYASPPANAGVQTTGGAAAGPLLYVTSNTDKAEVGADGRGRIFGLTLTEGKEVWSRSFDLEANAAPVVYSTDDRLLVVVGLGENAGLPWPLERWGVRWEGLVVALDAETGETVWSFAPPALEGQACRSSRSTQMCLPDAWTNAAVDGDGVVYIGWHGGFVYALDGRTGQVVGSHDLGAAMQGEPALAPGMLVVTTCTHATAWHLRQLVDEKFVPTES